ncbi:MAG: hypothetical protein R6U04_11950 [Bacteroidales bacterium]
MDKYLIDKLREREKELNCLYNIHEILRDEGSPLDVVLRKVVAKIPDGWQFPGICMARIECNDIAVTTPGFYKTKWSQDGDIIVEGQKIGKISVFYKEDVSDENNPLFLAEEQQLLNAIAGQISQYLFNRKLKQTLSFLNNQEKGFPEQNQLLQLCSGEHWQWRLEMAQYIADVTDFEYYGVEALYIIGSVKDATAGPKSDLDLLVHFEGSEEKKKLFKAYMKGWGLCLAKLNAEKTGIRIKEGLIDLHFVTSSEIKNKTNSFAVMVTSYNNSARLLKKKKV